MILKQILNGRQHSDFIVIKDNVTINGTKLLKLFIENNLNRGNHVTFLMYEYAENEITNIFSSYKNFTVYNCFDDPSNWLGKDVNKLEIVKSQLMNNNGEPLNVIIIDSLTYLLLHDSFHSVCDFLKTVLGSNTDSFRRQIITVAHIDFWPEGSTELRQIDCLAKTILTLHHDDEANLNSIVTEYRKPSGKVVKEEYTYWLDSSGNLKYEIIKMKGQELSAPETNPMNLTTFKLSLEENEKESRSRVVLPYKKTEEGSGKIFYVPDANDDWDDEDPDDDLEI